MNSHIDVGNMIACMVAMKFGTESICCNVAQLYYVSSAN